MEAYYILSGVLFLFFFGSGCIMYDMVYNREEEIIIHKRKNIAPQPILNDDYEIDDNLFDD